MFSVIEYLNKKTADKTAVFLTAKSTAKAVLLQECYTITSDEVLLNPEKKLVVCGHWPVFF